MLFLVTSRDLAQRSNGIQVIDLDGDGTTAVLRDPMESNQMMSPKVREYAYFSHKAKEKLCRIWAF